MITSGVPSTLVRGCELVAVRIASNSSFQQALEFVDILDLLAVGFVPQFFQNFVGRSRAEVGANQRGFEIVESGSIDLFADGNNVFDAFGQVLARARDGLLHALYKTWFLYFIQTAKESLNHEVSENDCPKMIIGESAGRKLVICNL